MNQQGSLSCLRDCEAQATTERPLTDQLPPGPPAKRGDFFFFLYLLGIWGWVPPVSRWRSPASSSLCVSSRAWRTSGLWWPSAASTWRKTPGWSSPTRPSASSTRTPLRTRSSSPSSGSPPMVGPNHTPAHPILVFFFGHIFFLKLKFQKFFRHFSGNPLQSASLPTSLPCVPVLTPFSCLSDKEIALKESNNMLHGDKSSSPVLAMLEGSGTQ